MAVVVAVLAAISLGGNLSPVKAEGPYNIRAGGVPTWSSPRFPGNSSGSITEMTFAQRRCDPSLLTNPAVQGLDAYILNVSAYAGQTIQISWTWSGSTGTKMYANIYDAGCRLTRQAASTGYSASVTDQAQYLLLPEQASMAVTVADASRWMLVVPEAKMDVSFTVNPY